MCVEIEDVIIVGAGPAGIACALQLIRHDIKPRIFEKKRIGGLVRNAHLVENYPGFAEGVSGPHLTQLLEKQLKRAGVAVDIEEIINPDISDSIFIVETPRQTVRSHRAVVASGTKPRFPADLLVERTVADRVLYEVCDIEQVENRTIAIIGAGDAAFDYALHLADNNEIVMLIRNDRLRCLPLLLERCRESNHISLLTNRCVREIGPGDDGRLCIACLHNGRHDDKLTTDYVLVAVGREPNLGFMSPELERQRNALMGEGKLYFAGDVTNGGYRQVAISVGDGVKVAMQLRDSMQGSNG